MSSAVVTAVAETKSVRSHEMTPLYAAVDPDALNELFDWDSGRDPVHVAFDYEECAVEIGRDRTITVERISKAND